VRAHMQRHRNSWILVFALAAAPALGQVKPCSDGPVLDTAEAASAAAAATADASTFVRGIDRCPTVSAGSKFTWSYNQGPDFGVCYGSESGTNENVFGVYLGNFPSFNPKDGVVIGQGVVAGHEVAWYKQDPRNDSSEFSRQTLVVFCHDPN